MQHRSRNWRPLTVRSLDRRTFLRAATRASLGAVGLVLVGCGDDERQGSIPVIESPAADDSGDRAPSPQSQTQNPDEQAIVDDGSQAQAASRPAADAPDPPQPLPQPRRLLDPDRRCADCTLEDPAFEPMFGSTVRFGLHEGAAYRMEVPPNWRGTLVLWAHGFGGLNDTGTGFQPHLGFDELPFREVLLPAGLAWATSTYSANGFVPALGVDDLLRTKDLFIEEFGPPELTICAAGSLGGATAQLMAQEFPDEIDGAVALCGALSNAEQVDYIASFHALALYFIGQPPPAGDAQTLVDWGAQLGGPDGEGGLSLTPAGEQFVAVVRELTGGDRWAFVEGLAAQWRTNFQLGAIVWPDVLASRQSLSDGATIQHNASSVAFDTRSTVYTAVPESGVDLLGLNDQVIRFAPPPGARDNPALGPATGRLKVPLLTIKGTGDLFTPISLDQAYARRVRAQGDQDNLVQRAVRHAGHCNFSTAESLALFVEIRQWLEDGARPSGEDLTGDLEAAGVAFTSPFDPGDPLDPLF